MTFQPVDDLSPERIHSVWCDDDDFVDADYFANHSEMECLTLQAAVTSSRGKETT